MAITSVPQILILDFEFLEFEFSGHSSRSVWSSRTAPGAVPGTGPSRL